MSAAPTLLATADGGMLVVNGSPAALAGFADALTTLAKEGGEAAAPPAGDDGTWRPLRATRVALDPKREDLALAVEGDTLVVHASERALGWLTDLISSFASGAIPGGSPHMHVEHYPQHPWLAEDSVPAVLELDAGAT